MKVGNDKRNITVFWQANNKDLTWGKKIENYEK